MPELLMAGTAAPERSFGGGLETGVTGWGGNDGDEQPVAAAGGWAWAESSVARTFSRPPKSGGARCTRPSSPSKKLYHRAIQATLIALALSLFVPAAHAEGHQFELVAGYYFTSNIELPGLGTSLGMDDDATYGLRYGYRRSEKIGFGVMWTHLEVDAAREDRAQILCSACDFDANFFDFSLEFYPGGGNFGIFVGPGWVSGDVTVRVPGPENNVDASDDAFTFHVGVAYTFEAGERFYIRPEARFRFLELDTAGDARYDDEDSQLGLGLGWRF